MDRRVWIVGAALSLTSFAGVAHATFNVIPKQQYVRVTASGLKGRTHRLVSGLEHHVALAAFQLSFEDKDHQVRGLGVMPASDRIHSVFGADDFEKPYTFRANYVKTAAFRGSRSYEARRTGCTGTGPCELTIERQPAGQHFVLQGFEVMRIGGVRNVLQLSIRPDGPNGKANVVFRDNKLSGAPFDVRLRYAYVARALFREVGTVSGRRTDNQRSISLPVRTRGQVALVGFDLRFDNGDHFLRHVELDGGSGHIHVVFNDNNFDDPYTATVDYGVLDDDAWQ